jgi:hypothetical protein
MKSGLICGFHGGGGYCNNLTNKSENNFTIIYFFKLNLII